jgi:hypothetical protein
VLLYFYWNEIPFSSLCVSFVLSLFDITSVSLRIFLSIKLVFNSDIFVE